ncbi:hypothetical protein [Nonomuraea sp. bgisy101]|uniref:hypothetical protein n=1 Tax=Nonomuraea sp. bgisy101 TaxID=3413784 RepID=UPI003D70F628
MLDILQRTDRYLGQTGRDELTPRQLRRVKHKTGHQSHTATLTRENKAALKRAARQARQLRTAGLITR